MSIIIKGIDKPLFCNECPCWNEEYTRCQVKDSWGKGNVYYAPPEWCPIEEVPED